MVLSPLEDLIIITRSDAYRFQRHQLLVARRFNRFVDEIEYMPNHRSVPACWPESTICSATHDDRITLQISIIDVRHVYHSTGYVSTSEPILRRWSTSLR